MPGAPLLMIASPTLISEAEYLATTYHPDCDFIDGQIQERNLGQKDHSKVQGRVFAWFDARAAQLGIAAFPEMRIRIAHGRYRITDVCVVKLPEPDEQIFTAPPYIAIEILSPEDTLRRLQERFDDYLAMGIVNIWVVDPESARAWHATADGLIQVRDAALHTTDGAISMPLAAVFF